MPATCMGIQIGLVEEFLVFEVVEQAAKQVAVTARLNLRERSATSQVAVRRVSTTTTRLLGLASLAATMRW